MLVGARSSNSAGPTGGVRTAQRVGPATIRVLPGELHTSRTGRESLVTVLGSCVAACVRDPATGFGGMNHFMLPESETGDWNGVSSGGRYGNLAMDSLLSEILATGCTRQSLEIKIFGGADLYRGSILVGRKNVEFIHAYLSRQRLIPTAMDLGGTWGRKIVFTPSTGRVLRQIIKPHSEDENLGLEMQYRQARGNFSIVVPVRRGS